MVLKIDPEIMACLDKRIATYYENRSLSEGQQVLQARDSGEKWKDIAARMEFSVSTLRRRMQYALALNQLVKSQPEYEPNRGWRVPRYIKPPTGQQFSPPDFNFNSSTPMSMYAFAPNEDEK